MLKIRLMNKVNYANFKKPASGKVLPAYGK